MYYFVQSKVKGNSYSKWRNVGGKINGYQEAVAKCKQYCKVGDKAMFRVVSVTEATVYNHDYGEKAL